MCVQVHPEPREEQLLHGRAWREGPAGELLPGAPAPEDLRRRPGEAAQGGVRHLDLDLDVVTLS